jgi:hypothetical protein
LSQQGRPLIPAERELLECFASHIDLDRVRIHNSPTWLTRLVGLFTGGSAIALGYRVFLPGRISLPTLAHELTHVSQFERWGAFRYFTLGVWNQLVLRSLLRRNVYRWEFQPGKSFADYGMEQQGQIVQDCFDITSTKRAAAQVVSPYSPGNKRNSER